VRISRRQAALKAIQALNTVQAQCYSQFGRFAQSLTELGPPASGTNNSSSASLISADLASGDKRGYKFSLAGRPNGSTISAAPPAATANSLARLPTRVQRRRMLP